MEIWTQLGQETSLRQQGEIAEEGKEEKEEVKALFECALQLIRAGGDYRITGPQLVVANVRFDMNEDEKKGAWEAINEGDRRTK